MNDPRRVVNRENEKELNQTRIRIDELREALKINEEKLIMERVKKDELEIKYESLKVIIKNQWYRMNMRYYLKTFKIRTQNQNQG